MAKVSTNPLALLVLVIVASILETSGTERECVSADHYRVDQCYANWGYELTAVPRPDAAIWDIDTLISYCRNARQQGSSGCLRNAYSACIFSAWEGENEALRRLGDATDRAIDYMCSRVRVLKANKSCVKSAVYEITHCVRDTATAADQLYMEMSLANQPITWDIVRGIKEREAQDLTTCVDDLLRSRCNRQVARVFKTFFHAAYRAYAEQ